MPDAAAPPEWTPGPTTDRERVLRVASGGPPLLSTVGHLLAALVRALS